MQISVLGGRGVSGGVGPYPDGLPLGAALKEIKKEASLSAGPLIYFLRYASVIRICFIKTNLAFST